MTTRRLSYADYDLLLETYAVQSFIEQQLNLSDCYPVAEPHLYDPKINYPAHPPVKLNTLYWPQGASRWAFFAGLVCEEDANKIQDEIEDTAAQDLILGDKEFQMCALAPRPIAGDFTQGKTRLWLLPLVDKRFWWQFENTGDLELDGATTWETFLLTLCSQLDESPEIDGIHGDYGTPHPDASRDYHNVPSLLDAAVHSVGMRFLAYPDGTYRVRDWSNSRDELLINVEGREQGQGNPESDKNRENSGVGPILAGGLMLYPQDYDKPEPGEILANATVPEKVAVSFPELCDNAPRLDEDRHEIVKELSDLPADETTIVASEQKPGSVKNIRSWAGANYIQTNTTVLDNSSELDDLATRIASDYFQSVENHFDIKYGCIRDWEPTGFDEMTIYTYGRLRSTEEGPDIIWHESPVDVWDDEEGPREVSTRVYSWPINQGIEEQLSWGAPVHKGTRWGEAIEDDQDANSGVTGHNCRYVRVNPVDNCEGDNPDTGITHIVILPDDVEISTGDVFPYWPTFDCRWVTTSGQSSSGVEIIRFQLTAPLSLGGTATATVLACSGPVSGTVTVEDFTAAPGKFRGPSGYQGVAYKWPEDTGCNWTIVMMEHKAIFVVGDMTTSWSGAAGAREATITVNDWWQGKDPGASVQIIDRCDLYFHVSPTSGNPCLAGAYDEQEDKYVAIDGSQLPVADELCARTLGRGTIVGWTNATDNGPIDPFDEINANLDTNLRMFVDDNDGKRAMISIDPSYYANSVMWSNAVQVRWTRKPHIGRYLIVGEHAAQGGDDTVQSYLELQSSAAKSTRWRLISDGDVHQDWLSPNDAPGVAANLVVGDVDTVVLENCVKLYWTEPGVGDGAGGNQDPVSLMAYDGSECQLTFDRGVLVRIIDKKDDSDKLTPPAGDGDANCNLITDSDWDPCEDP